MSDISKCTGATMGVICPQRKSCWRFLAPESPWRQSWIGAPFVDSGCREYWEAKPAPKDEGPGPKTEAEIVSSEILLRASAIPPGPKP
jgi:hypothetical protein